MRIYLAGNLDGERELRLLRAIYQTRNPKRKIRKICKRGEYCSKGRMRVKIYLAGNLPQASLMTSEYKAAQKATLRYHYRRLTSFYYRKETANVIAAFTKYKEDTDEDISSELSGGE